MSFQVCHCGWSKQTSYKGLRTHQGKMGCTPKGMSIPEGEQFRFQYLIPNLTFNSIQIEEPLLTSAIKSALLSGSEQSIRRDHREKSQEKDRRLNTPARKENAAASPNLTAPTIPTEAAGIDASVIEMIKSFIDAQQEIDFASGAQVQQNSRVQSSPMPQIFGTPVNPAAAEVTVKETNQSSMHHNLFETPSHHSTTHQTTTNARRALDFSPTKPSPKPMSQTFSTQRNPAEESETESEPESESESESEITMKETNQSRMQHNSFGTPQNHITTHQTTTNSNRVLDFPTGVPSLMPMPQIFGTQRNPAAAEVTVKETNQSSMHHNLFGTPQHHSTTHQTTTNSNRVLDFSTGMPSPKPMSQTFSTQRNPAEESETESEPESESESEITMKETNQSRMQHNSFGTPQHHITTHQTTTNSNRVLDFPTGVSSPMPQIFGTQRNPAAAEVTVKETNQSSMHHNLFGTPQHHSTTHQTTTNSNRVLDFPTGMPSPKPMSQTFSTQRNPAEESETESEPESESESESEITMKETNQSRMQHNSFGTPQNHSTTHQTTTNSNRVLDFPTGVPSLMPMSQIVGTPVNPAAAEVTVKETNQSMFGTPQHHITTHQTTTNSNRVLDFPTSAQQVGQLFRDPPTTTAQETAVRPKEREEERKREEERRREEVRRREEMRKRQEEKERETQKLQKARQDRIRADLWHTIQAREQKMAEVRSSVKACKGGLDAEWLEINEVFSEVMKVVEDARQKALQPLEERRQRVKDEAQDLVEKLQNEIDKLKNTIDELDKNPSIQVSPPTGLDESRDWKNVTVDTSFSFGTLRTTTSNMVAQIHQKLEHLSSVELKRIPSFAVDVKLDPATAHQSLLLSRNMKMVADSGKKPRGPDAPQRFDMFGSILGLNRLTSGKSYWEVEVSKKTGWDLGVARRDANRKGILSLNPDNGYWVTVHYENEKYAALAAPPVSLSLTEKPQKVGVFVDYEEGLVSFYDVTAQTHIYSFTECSFSDAIFPYFSPHLKQNEKNAQPLIISAIKKQ